MCVIFNKKNSQEMFRSCSQPKRCKQMWQKEENFIRADPLWLNKAKSTDIKVQDYVTGTYYKATC